LTEQVALLENATCDENNESEALNACTTLNTNLSLQIALLVPLLAEFNPALAHQAATGRQSLGQQACAVRKDERQHRCEC
jgi:hypothetical protein